MSIVQLILCACRVVLLFYPGRTLDHGDLFRRSGQSRHIDRDAIRKVNPAEIVRPLISATKAGLDLDIGQMEAHYLAGGDVERVVTALISADRANIELPWKRATAIDLAGRDVLEAVQVSVNPKVIQTPRIAAVAKDGIQVIAVARVTVRANIERLVGGAGEETIIARVGEGTVSSIGSAQTHKDVLENPGPDLETRARTGTRLRYRLRDSLDRYRRRRRWSEHRRGTPD